MGVPFYNALIILGTPFKLLPLVRTLIGCIKMTREEILTCYHHLHACLIIFHLLQLINKCVDHLNNYGSKPLLLTNIWSHLYE